MSIVGPVRKDPDTALFLDGTARGFFMFQSCTACGAASGPQSILCPVCESDALQSERASGRATLVSWSVMEGKPAADGSKQRTIVAVAELDEGPWWWSQVIDVEPDELSTGSVFAMEFHRASPEDEAVPVFTLVRPVMRDGGAREADRPLRGVRVVDLAYSYGELTARHLAELGADVIHVEPPEGSPSRRQGPLFGGVGLRHALHNADKRGIVLDLGTAVGQDALLALTDVADLLIVDALPEVLLERGIDVDKIRQINPRLVVVSLTDFGLDGPYRDWVGTEWTHLAMGGVLSRSGLPGLPPLMPPVPLAGQSAAVQAAWAGLLAFYNRLTHGVGDLVDVSVYESAAQMIDPGYGMGGGALAGKSPADGPRGRPDALHLYPIFPCADGHVRILLQSARQWHGMRAWLGEPEEFAGPEYDRLLARYDARATLYPLIAAVCTGRSRDEIVATGQQYGVPTAGLLSLGEVAENPHFVERHAIAPVTITPGDELVVPNGFLEINGVRAGLGRAAPRLGEHDAEISERPWIVERRRPEVAPEPARAARPLEGIRVLDLGVIIVGGEATRVLSDLGAEVIKVENALYPDGARQSFGGEVMSNSFARGNRGKLSCGVNLRTDEGKEVFRRLVSASHVVVSNFKPGTMDALGFGIAELHTINPDLVIVESSALGASGPWSKRMGYGPLVRANTGITDLWRYPDVEGSYCDAATAFPDHAAGRVGAMSAIAGLIGVVLNGGGSALVNSQAEIVLSQMSELFAADAISPGTVRPVGNSRPGDAPRGVYACAGDDEWCVVDVRDSEDWSRLCGLMGRPALAEDPRFADASARVAHRVEVDEVVSAWMADLAPRDAMRLIQEAGVPAGMMQRFGDMAGDAHLLGRGFFGRLDQPQAELPLTVDMGAARFEHIATPELRPAPMMGADTREICERVLGLDQDRIEQLVASGDVQPAADESVLS